MMRLGCLEGSCSLICISRNSGGKNSANWLRQAISIMQTVIFNFFDIFHINCIYTVFYLDLDFIEFIKHD